jgi:cytidylate kinase
VLTDAFKKTDMPPKPIVVIAVDGPAASGKGTLAKALAARLGYAYLDTGALYRNVALATLKAGGDPAKIGDVRPALEILKHLTPEALTDAALRSAEVADAAAKIAVIPEVRAAVRRYQDDFAKNPPGNAGGVVLDGRDIGTVVCPAADIKFFVTATPEERARRRFEELKSRNPNLTRETVLKDINERDHRDSSRKVSPLRAADDAHILDTTGLTPVEALDKALKVVRAKFPPASNDNSSGGPQKFKPDV